MVQGVIECEYIIQKEQIAASYTDINRMHICTIVLFSCFYASISSIYLFIYLS